MHSMALRIGAAAPAATATASGVEGDDEVHGVYACSAGEAQQPKPTPRYRFRDGYEEIEKIWSPAIMPDYNYDRRKAGGSESSLKHIATDSEAFAYFESLQRLQRRTSILPRKQKKKKSGHRDKGTVSEEEAKQKGKRGRIGKGTVSQEEVTHKEKASTSFVPKHKMKRSVWITFSEAIEAAIQNDSKSCPIPGPTHPLQKDTKVEFEKKKLEYKGEDDLITFEECLPMQPLCPIPSLKEYALA